MAQHHGTRIPHGQRRDVCFLGGYRHPPNIDAVQYFCAEIFPLLRAAEPGIRFLIAGSNLPSELAGLAAEDVIIAGQIEDLRDLFEGDLRWLRHYGFRALDFPTLAGGLSG